MDIDNITQYHAYTLIGCALPVYENPLDAARAFADKNPMFDLNSEVGVLRYIDEDDEVLWFVFEKNESEVGVSCSLSDALNPQTWFDEDECTLVHFLSNTARELDAEEIIRDLHRHAT